MTDHEMSGPDVLVRARLAPMASSRLASGAEVRRLADRRRRQQWVSGAAAVAVLAVGVALAPWAVPGGDGGLVAVDPDAGAADLGYTLPPEWGVLREHDERHTCVGPAGADGCPVAISVAADPTLGADPFGALASVIADCPRGAYRDLRILSEAQGDPPASTYRGGCDAPRAEGPTKTLVALDTGVAWATTWDPDLLEETRAIVASFEVPQGWRTEPPPQVDEPEPSAPPSVS